MHVGPVFFRSYEVSLIIRESLQPTNQVNEELKDLLTRVRS